MICQCRLIRWSPRTGMSGTTRCSTWKTPCAVPTRWPSRPLYEGSSVSYQKYNLAKLIASRTGHVYSLLSLRVLRGDALQYLQQFTRTADIPSRQAQTLVFIRCCQSLSTEVHVEVNCRSPRLSCRRCSYGTTYRRALHPHSRCSH